MGDTEALLLGRVQRGGIAMSLKDLNLGSAQPAPKDWIPDKRFIAYEYGPFRVQASPVPQQPTGQIKDRQPLKSSSLGSRPTDSDHAVGEELDFQVAMRRRNEPAGASLAEIGKKYGL